VPYVSQDVENGAETTIVVSPLHIQPEWYVLQYYAILRSIPNKLSGVIAMATGVLMLYTLRFCQPVGLDQLTAYNTATHVQVLICGGLA